MSLTIPVFITESLAERMEKHIQALGAPNLHVMITACTSVVSKLLDFQNERGTIHCKHELGSEFPLDLGAILREAFREASRESADLSPA